MYGNFYPYIFVRTTTTFAKTLFNIGRAKIQQKQQEVKSFRPLTLHSDHIHEAATQLIFHLNKRY